MEKELFEKAAIIFERILAINPNDNQGMRDPLLHCYLELEKLDKALNLCNQCRDDILVGITYGRALVLYKLGKKEQAKKQFIAAMQSSPRVAKELIKSKHTKPKDYGRNPGIEIGSEEEAYEYWKYYGKIWESTPGAIEFIKDCLTANKKSRV